MQIRFDKTVFTGNLSTLNSGVCSVYSNADKNSAYTYTRYPLQCEF